MSDTAPDGIDPDDERPEQRANVRPISAAALATFAIIGLVGGWILRRVADGFGWQTPLVSWSQVIAPYVATGALSILAWVTWNQLQRRKRPGSLNFQRAVNRLVLARASALVGCLMAGGYLGYALSWLWVQGDFAVPMAVRAALAGVGGILMTISALTLQRACRIRHTGHSDLV